MYFNWFHYFKNTLLWVLGNKGVVIHLTRVIRVWSAKVNALYHLTQQLSVDVTELWFYYISYRHMHYATVFHIVILQSYVEYDSTITTNTSWKLSGMNSCYLINFQNKTQVSTCHKSLFPQPVTYRLPIFVSKCNSIPAYEIPKKTPNTTWAHYFRLETSCI